MNKNSSLLKKVEQSGFILLLLFLFQPILDFTKTNINDQVFNFLRTLSYFAIIFISSLFVIYLLKKVFRNNNILKITSIVGFFCFFTFNYYLISKPFQLLPQFNNIGGLILISWLLLFIFISFILYFYINYLILRIFLYSILGTIIFFDLFIIIPNYYYVVNHNPIVNFTMPPKMSGDINNSENNHNVYFLIPDALPAPDRINNIFFDGYNYNEINELKELNFKILNNVKSNAIDSYTSIPHFFSMDYLFKKNGKIKPSLHVELNNIFKGYNPVVAEFRKRKYKYVRVNGGGHVSGCLGIEDICMDGQGSFLTNQDLVFLDRSYIAVILNKLNTINLMHPLLRKLNLRNNQEIIAPDGRKFILKTSRSDLLLTDSIIAGDLFNEILPSISESPYFFHWWMPFPHAPIRFNDKCEQSNSLNGEFINPYEINFEKWSDSYAGQTKCAEKELVKYAKKIIEHDKNAIILIHSDHGIDHALVRAGVDLVKRRDLSNVSFENMLGMFAAYRMPKRCDKFLDPAYSPVNAFRIIFACLDNTEPNLLTHKTFLINAEHTEVEGILEKNEFGKYVLKNFNHE